MDRCLGTGAVPRQLEAQGYEVKCHESMFPPKERDDTNWLSLVGENNWPALSADKGIKRKQIERDALIEFRVRYFVFRNTLLDHEASDFGPLKIATTQSHQIQTVLAYLLKVAASDHEAILKEPRAIRELLATQANESNRRSD